MKHKASTKAGSSEWLRGSVRVDDELGDVGTLHCSGQGRRQRVAWASLQHWFVWMVMGRLLPNTSAHHGEAP